MRSGSREEKEQEEEEEEVTNLNKEMEGEDGREEKWRRREGAGLVI